ncbi:MAG: hypothetical protein LBM38_01145 [Clostridiales bacterium]|jgi:hypothetical protein|nr:hypothetical protein [Clostridiales bacterium]
MLITKQKLKKFFSSIGARVIALSAIFALTPIIALADPIADVAAPAIGFASRLIGGGIVLFGAYQTALAFKDEAVGGKVKGIMVIVAGAMLYALGAMDLSGFSVYSSGPTPFPGEGSLLQIANSIAQWIPGFGSAAALYGIFTLIIGFKDDAPGEKIKGMKFIVGGIMMAQICGVAQALL